MGSPIVEENGDTLNDTAQSAGPPVTEDSAQAPEPNPLRADLMQVTVVLVLAESYIADIAPQSCAQWLLCVQVIC